jgi:hypothetical protein
MSESTATSLSEPEVATAPEAAPRSRWRDRLTGDYGKAFLLVLAWQAYLTVLGRALEPLLPVFEGTPPTMKNAPTLLSHTFRWDSVDFEGIMRGTIYIEQPQSPAFYPLFPLVVWLVQNLFLNKVGFLVVGLLVNTVSTWLGVTALLKITRHHLAGERAAWLVVAAFLTAPSAYFLHGFYSEAVFVALAFWAYLFALRRQWVWMGLCLMPITAVRVTAVLFVGLCFLEFWKSKGWRLRGLLSWHLLWFPAAATGFLGYALYLKLLVGDPLAMFHAYKAGPGWAYHKFSPNIISTLYGQVVHVWGVVTGKVPLDLWVMVSFIIPMAGLVLLLITSAYVLHALRAEGVVLASFGLASFVLFTLNSNVVSVHRYLLPCVVIYIGLVLAAQRRQAFKPVFYGVMYVGVAIQTLLFMLFVSGNWSG